MAATGRRQSLAPDSPTAAPSRIADVHQAQGVLANSEGRATRSHRFRAPVTLERPRRRFGAPYS